MVEFTKDLDNNVGTWEKVLRPTRITKPTSSAIHQIMTDETRDNHSVTDHVFEEKRKQKKPERVQETTKLLKNRHFHQALLILGIKTGLSPSSVSRKLGLGCWPSGELGGSQGGPPGVC